MHHSFALLQLLRNGHAETADHAKRVREIRALIGPAAGVGVDRCAPRKQPHSAANAPPAAEEAVAGRFISRGIAGKHERSVKRRADGKLCVGPRGSRVAQRLVGVADRGAHTCHGQKNDCGLSNAAVSGCGGEHREPEDRCTAKLGGFMSCIVARGCFSMAAPQGCGKGTPNGSSGSLRPFAKNETVW